MPFFCDLSHEKWYSVLGGYFELSRKLFLDGQRSVMSATREVVVWFPYKEKTRAEIDRLREGGHATNIWRVRGGGIFFSMQCPQGWAWNGRIENLSPSIISWFLSLQTKLMLNLFLASCNSKRRLIMPQLSPCPFLITKDCFGSPQWRKMSSLQCPPLFLLYSGLDQWSVWPVIMQCPSPSIIHRATSTHNAANIVI